MNFKQKGVILKLGLIVQKIRRIFKYKLVSKFKKQDDSIVCNLVLLSKMHAKCYAKQF